MPASADEYVGDDPDAIYAESGVVIPLPNRLHMEGVKDRESVPRRRYCAYCGTPSWGYTCKRHADLPGLDRAAL